MTLQELTTKIWAIRREWHKNCESGDKLTHEICNRLEALARDLENLYTLEKEKPMTTKTPLEIMSAAYDVDDTLHRAANGEDVGDTLAVFLVRELEDVGPEHIIRAIDDAVDQLLNVSAALQIAGFPTPYNEGA